MPLPALSASLIAPALMLGAAPVLASAADSLTPVDAHITDGMARDGVQFAQVTVHERIIIRVPRMATARTPAAAARLSVPQPIRYKEKKGPKCIAVADIGGALVSAPDAVDLVLAGGKRLRAHLDDCGPMDFYNGFYLRPKADGKVCADRDVLRMRSGASCGIAKFKTLVAR